MTTTISRDNVLHLAELSNLELSESEVASLQEDLGNILGYVEQLSELDTSGVEPTYQVTDRQNIFRTDEVQPNSVNREELLSLSDEQKDKQIKVPKVL